LVASAQSSVSLFPKLRPQRRTTASPTDKIRPMNRAASLSRAAMNRGRLGWSSGTLWMPLSYSPKVKILRKILLSSCVAAQAFTVGAPFGLMIVLMTFVSSSQPITAQRLGHNRAHG